MQEDEILLIDKPAGWTSFDVVAKIRGRRKAAFREAGIVPTKRMARVGHAGTLDPFATGLLILLLGDATKKADEFLKLDKVYEATFFLGKTSTTGDPEGDITDVSQHQPSNEEVVQELEKFVGEIEQTPSAYSAIKIDGQRAYKLAREGKKVDMPTRRITIHSLDLLSYEYPEVKIRTEVSSGTYIRSLAEDFGKALSVGAYCSELRRTQIAAWSVGNANSVEAIVKT